MDIPRTLWNPSQARVWDTLARRGVDGASRRAAAPADMAAWAASMGGQYLPDLGVVFPRPPEPAPAPEQAPAPEPAPAPEQAPAPEPAPAPEQAEFARLLARVMRRLCRPAGPRPPKPGSRYEALARAGHPGVRSDGTGLRKGWIVIAGRPQWAAAVAATPIARW